MGRLPKPTRDALIYVAENGVRLLIAGVVGILVARHLGPDQFGLLGYGLSIFGIAATVASLQMRPILVRELSGDGDWRVLVASAAPKQLAAASVLAILGAGLVIWTRGGTGEAILIAVLLFPVPFLALSDTLRALLEVRGETGLIVKASLAAAVVSSGLKLIAIAAGATVWVFAATTTVELAVLAIGLSWKFVGRRTAAFARRHYSRDTAKRLLRQSWPLILSALAIQTLIRVDIVLLGLMAGDTAAGVYSAAARLSEMWYFIPMAALAALRPRLAKLFTSGQHELYRVLTQRFITIGFAVALAVAIVTLLTADALVGFLFGADFDEAAAVLKVHIFAAPFVFIGVASDQWLIDRDLSKHLLFQTTAGAVVNILLNLVLIPGYGPLGAAIATLVAYAIASVVTNAVRRSTLPLLKMQLKSVLLRWR